MTRLAAAAAWITLSLSWAASAQIPAPEFEAADVHVSPTGATESGGLLPAGRVEFRSMTLLRLISFAYGIPVERVTGGPSWIDTDRFDIVAKAPADAIGSKPCMLAMLQNLLAQRFDLAVRQEDRQLPVYALVLAKRGVAKESAGQGTPDCKRTVEDTISYTCRNTTLAGLTQALPAIAPAYFGIPVVDRTDLRGAYDFTLEWVGRGQLPPGPPGLADGRSIFSSLEKQLGVRAEEQTTSEPVLIIAHTNRTPAANPPGITEILGAAPTEFEVADVRPSRPDETESFKLENGRIDARAISLRDLIEFAYDVENDQLNGGEKWLDSEKFDITAKTAPTASPDTLRVMLQSLLAERFALKFHRSRQPVTVYALTSVKPKLKNADPAERSTCNLSLADGKRAFICQNITMPQFAERLRPASTGYIDHPVVDLTGLEGSYDFTATWAPRNRALRRANAGPSIPGDVGGIGPASAAADPSAELTLFEALERQLGLKLALQKHPMPVIVIDHIDRKPADN